MYGDTGGKIGEQLVRLTQTQLQIRWINAAQPDRGLLLSQTCNECISCCLPSLQSSQRKMQH